MMARIKMFGRKDGRSRGQSMVELALLFPILLILLSGLIEFGFMLNEYLTLMDAARNAARFASDGLYYQWDNIGTSYVEGTPMDMSYCQSTRHFYRQAACLVNQELSMEAPVISMLDPDNPNFPNDPPPGYEDPNPSNGYLDPAEGNDIVISAFSFTENVGITARHPNNDGWSYAEDLDYLPGKVSRFTTADVTSSFISMNSPSTGYILVEIFYNYHHKLGLPWITAFIDDPLPLHVYAFMPLTSAEPTPIPIP